LNLILELEHHPTNINHLNPPFFSYFFTIFCYFDSIDAIISFIRGYLILISCFSWLDFSYRT